MWHLIYTTISSHRLSLSHLPTHKSCREAAAGVGRCAQRGWRKVAHRRGRCCGRYLGTPSAMAILSRCRTRGRCLSWPTSVTSATSSSLQPKTLSFRFVQRARPALAKYIRYDQFKCLHICVDSGCIGSRICVGAASKKPRSVSRLR